MKLTLCRFEFKLEDMWVGAFWKHTTCTLPNGEEARFSTDIWICLLPCLPLHLTFIYKVLIDMNDKVGLGEA